MNYQKTKPLCPNSEKECVSNISRDHHIQGKGCGAGVGNGRSLLAAFYSLSSGASVFSWGMKRKRNQMKERNRSLVWQFYLSFKEYKEL